MLSDTSGPSKKDLGSKISKEFDFSPISLKQNRSPSPKESEDNQVRNKRYTYFTVLESSSPNLAKLSVHSQGAKTEVTSTHSLNSANDSNFNIKGDIRNKYNFGERFSFDNKVTSNGSSLNEEREEDKGGNAKKNETSRCLEASGVHIGKRENNLPSQPPYPLQSTSLVAERQKGKKILLNRNQKRAVGYVCDKQVITGGEGEDPNPSSKNLLSNPPCFPTKNDDTLSTDKINVPPPLTSDKQNTRREGKAKDNVGEQCQPPNAFHGHELIEQQLNQCKYGFKTSQEFSIDNPINSLPEQNDCNTGNTSSSNAEAGAGKQGTSSYEVFLWLDSHHTKFEEYFLQHANFKLINKWLNQQGYKNFQEYLWLSRKNSSLFGDPLSTSSSSSPSSKRTSRSSSDSISRLSLLKPDGDRSDFDIVDKIIRGKDIGSLTDITRRHSYVEPTLTLRLINDNILTGHDIDIRQTCKDIQKASQKRRQTFHDYTVLLKPPYTNDPKIVLSKGQRDFVAPLNTRRRSSTSTTASSCTPCQCQCHSSHDPNKGECLSAISNLDTINDDSNKLPSKYIALDNIFRKLSLTSTRSSSSQDENDSCYNTINQSQSQPNTCRECGCNDDCSSNSSTTFVAKCPTCNSELLLSEEFIDVLYLIRHNSLDLGNGDRRRSSGSSTSSCWRSSISSLPSHSEWPLGYGSGAKGSFEREDIVSASQITPNQAAYTRPYSRRNNSLTEHINRRKSLVATDTCPTIMEVNDPETPDDSIAQRVNATLPNFSSLPPYQQQLPHGEKKILNGISRNQVDYTDSGNASSSASLASKRSSFKGSRLIHSLPHSASVPAEVDKLCKGKDLSPKTRTGPQSPDDITFDSLIKSKIEIPPRDLGDLQTPLMLEKCPNQISTLLLNLFQQTSNKSDKAQRDGQSFVPNIIHDTFAESISQMPSSLAGSKFERLLYAYLKKCHQEDTLLNSLFHTFQLLDTTNVMMALLMSSALLTDSAASRLYLLEPYYSGTMLDGTGRTLVLKGDFRCDPHSNQTATKPSDLQQTECDSPRETMFRDISKTLSLDCASLVATCLVTVQPINLTKPVEHTLFNKDVDGYGLNDLDKLNSMLLIPLELTSLGRNPLHKTTEETVLEEPKLDGGTVKNVISDTVIGVIQILNKSPLEQTDDASENISAEGKARCRSSSLDMAILHNGDCLQHLLASSNASVAGDAKISPEYHSSQESKLKFYSVASDKYLPIKNATSLRSDSLMSPREENENDQKSLPQFNAEDEIILQKYAKFSAIALQNANIFEASRKEFERNKALLELIHDLYEEQLDMEKGIRKIMKKVIWMLKCNKCTVTIQSKDIDGPNIVNRTFEMSDDPGADADNSVIWMRSGSRESRNSIEFTITTQRKTSESLAPNIKELMELQTTPLFERTIATEILNQRKIYIGEIRAFDKLYHQSFNKNDEELLEIFAIFCGLVYDKSLLYFQMADTTAMKSVALEVLSYHVRAPDNRVQELKHAHIPMAKELRIEDVMFDDFSLSEMEMIEAGLRMFIDADFLDLFKIDYEVLCRWFLTTKRNYRSVLYHNWCHAFNVAQTMYAIMRRSFNIAQRYTPLNWLAMIVGCFSHDLDHRGLNNAYQIKTHSALEQLYGNEATMEFHHFNMAIMILHTDGHNILAGLTPEEYRSAIRLLKVVILATDLNVHFRTRDRFFELVNNDNFDWYDESHTFLLMGMLMSACDLSACFKRWDIQRKAVDLVTAEFFTQGDLEKQLLKIQPKPEMDREKETELPKLQASWLNDVCLPLFRALAKLDPYFDSCIKMIVSNRDRWINQIHDEPD